MGTDPRLNEEALLKWLRDGKPMSANGVRSALSLAALMAYDRKVTREFFAELLDLAAAIQITLTEIVCGARMHAALAVVDEAKEPNLLNAKIEEETKTWINLRRRLADTVEKLTLCPTSEDSIS